MAYITYQDYIGMYGAPFITEQEFPAYAGLASDLVDNITQHRISKGGGFSALPDLIQALVKKATGAQVLYFIQNGLETVLSGQTGQSFTVGKVSVSGGTSNAQAGGGALMVSPFTVSLLEQTYLMERGVHVCSDQFLNPFWGI